MPDDLTSPETVPEACEHAEVAIEAAHGRAARSDLRSGEHYPISDLIADLLHLGESYGHSTDELIGSATNHYAHEREACPHASSRADRG